MKGSWQSVGKKQRLILTKLGGGIHTGLPPENIPDGLCAAMENLHSRAYPQLSPRPPRNPSAYPHLPSGNLRFFGKLLGQRLGAVVGQTLYVLQNGAWQSAGTLFSASSGRVHHVDFMDYAFFADGTECKKYNGNAITAVGSVGRPENAAFLASHAWHLFSASPRDKYLRYSALEKPDDWAAPLDAGCELIESQIGAFGSALCAFGGHILYFKENAMFELYGTDPVNFSLLEISEDIGCIAQASLTEIGGILFFVGENGIYTYTGGARPKRIGFPVQHFLNRLDHTRRDRIAAGSDGTRYYLSLPQMGGGSVLLAYDTRVGEWYAEDDPGFFAFVSYEGKLLAASIDGTVSVFDGEAGERVSWSCTSPPLLFEHSRKQNWHRIYLRAEIGENAFCTVSLGDEDHWEEVGKMEESGLCQFEIPPRLWNRDRLSVHLAGMGEVRISSLEIECRGRERSYL